MVTYVYICTNGRCRNVTYQQVKRTHTCPKCKKAQMRLERTEK